MLTLTGKIYREPKVHTTTTGKKVVQFTVLDQFQFIAPDGELKTISTYYNCSYWKSESLAQLLEKGMMVTVIGHNKAEPYEKDGQWKARNAMHVELFSINGEAADSAPQPKTNGSKAAKTAKASKTATAPASVPAGLVNAGDDPDELPF